MHPQSLILTLATGHGALKQAWFKAKSGKKKTQNKTQRRETITNKIYF